MNIAEPLTVLKKELLENIVPQILALLEASLSDGRPLHQVEAGLWDLALQLGHKSLGAFLASHGTGDLGQTVALPDGRPVERLNELHPTVKPTGMIADALLDCSNRGDIVLDPFLGSGSTLMAAERTGRICRGVEIDPLYVDVAIRRWQRMTGERAVHAESGVDFTALEIEKSDARHDR